LFCGEHTRIYSRNLSHFLAKKGLFIWLENPLQIKRCSGFNRTKTDRYDSVVIAQYACHYVDKAVAYKPAEMHNREIAAYAHRKIAEGKPKRVVVNNVRSKLIQIIFAVVRSKIPYQENYLNQLLLSA
jgi:hypothetical protein